MPFARQLSAHQPAVSARRNGRRIVAWSATLILVVGTLLAFSPVVSSADALIAGENGGTGCTTVNRGAHRNVSFYYYDTLSSYVPALQNWSRTNNFGPTILSTTTDAKLDTQTDIIVRDGPYVGYCGFDWYNELDGGVLGLTQCDTVYSSGACRQHTVRYSSIYMDGATTSQRRGLVCHESGHAIGLLHSSNSNSCMKPGDSSPAQNYDSSEVGQINAAY